MAGVHAGHRGRMRVKAKEGGIAYFQPHEILELLLMQIIPQRDVNPLAHVLIDRFGSLEAVLTAPEEELVLVRGIGPRTAQWLRAVGEMALTYCECWRVPQSCVNNSREAIEYLRQYGNGREGDFLLVSLDHAGRVLHQGILPVGEEGFPSQRDMAQAALLHNAAQVFTVHYVIGDRPNGSERDFALYTSDTFNLIEIVHLDHIIARGDQYTSARRDGVIIHRFLEDAMAAERRNGKK